MVKEKLIELIQHKLDQVDESGKYIYEVVEGYCNTIWPFFIEESYLKNDLYDLDHYTKRYDSVAVATDATSGKYYSLLPSPIINSKYGVRRITTSQGDTAEFEPTTDFVLRHMQGLDVDILNDTIFYVTRQERVDYNDSMTSAIAAVGVSMYLIVEFNEYEDTDDINVPAGKLNEFVMAVFNLATNKVPVDNVNNNSEG